MKTTSTRKMQWHNRKRALIRIQKELQYISMKTRDGHLEQKDIMKAIYYVVEAIQK